MKKAFVFFAISLFAGLGFSACGGSSAGSGGVRVPCDESCDLMAKCGATSGADKCKKNCSADYDNEESGWACRADCWRSASSCYEGESCYEKNCLAQPDVDALDSGDAVLPDVENDASVSDELAAGETAVDPLEDYYWFEGQWEVTKGSPTCLGDIYDITIKDWNEENGALLFIHTLTNVWVIKKDEIGKYIVHNVFEDGSYSDGSAEKNLQIIQYTSYDEEGILNYHWELKKISN